MCFSKKELYYKCQRSSERGGATQCVICAFFRLFGVVFLAIGIAGFMPNFAHNGLLFGHFEVNGMHNAVHLISGAIALFAATKASYARLYFQVFGVLYAIVAVLGFVYAGNILMMHFNLADNYLHLVIAVVALYLGFLCKRQS